MAVAAPQRQSATRPRGSRRAWRVAAQKPMNAQSDQVWETHAVSTQDVRAERGATTAIQFYPSLQLISDADRLCTRFVRCLDDFQLHHFTLPQTVKCVGSWPYYDAAVAALVQLASHRSPWPDTSASSHIVLRPYTTSLTRLAETLRSSAEQPTDGAVVTTATLGLIDAFTLDPAHVEPTTMFKHFAGARALLLTCRKQTDVGRAIIYDLEDIISFIEPCYSGTSSLFESTHWECAEPPSREMPCSPHFYSLKRISHRLFVRLPGLVCLVRKLREGSALPSDMALARDLADSLNDIRDDEAESWLLHSVTIAQTSGHQLRTMLPVSFVFQSMEDLRAGVYYWQLRLIVTRIMITLHDQGKLDDINKLIQQETRLSKNIFMSWQPSLDFGAAGTAPLTMGLVAAWASVKTKATFNGFPTEVVGWWIKNSLKRTLTGWIVGSTVADLDTAADVLSGGPLTGPMVELFSTL